MRFTTLLGASLALVLASACGDDGGNNNGSCGDGLVTGSETCDDGNTTSGDGCSSSCKMESGKCGDNTVDVATEQCDDGNMASGDGCSATCQNESSGMCGNGAINGTEACDDGNMASNDGCSSTCIVESGYTCTGTPSVCTMGGGGGSCTAPKTLTLTAMGTDLVGTGTGDTTTGTSHQAEGACDGDVAGAGNDEIWKFTTTSVRDVVITLNDTTTFDGGIRLMTAPCMINTEITDILGGDDGCSDTYLQGGVEVLGYINLPAGTYYVSVDGYDATEKGAYDFTVTASAPGCGNGTLGPLELCDDGNTATGDGCDATCGPETGWNCDTSEPSVCQMVGCGDGIIQTGETCDDDNTAIGDGCNATCQIETGYTCSGEPSVCVMMGCGNGIVEAAEECDDGNMTNGDRCNSGCILEQDVTEAAEPNDTVPQALSAGSHIVRGSFQTGDTDLYTFTLTATSKVEIETYFTINGQTADYGGFGDNPLFDCTAADDTMVAVFAAGADTTMDTLALAADLDEGDSVCSYVGAGDGPDTDFEAGGADPTQLATLPAGTYTIRVTDDPTATAAITTRRYMLDVKIIPMGTGPVVPAAGDIKINEFLAADGGSTNGGVDSNCDGSFSNSDDEFIEFVNVSAKTLDLTGLTVADALGVKFTFAAQTSGSLTLAPGKAVVVWGGGAPACAGVTNFFTNGTAHTLSLNDTGDSITLATAGATPVTIATTTYTTTTIGTSLNLSPDVTGTAYALHSAVTGHVGNLSPGKKVDGTAF
ncbi:MAG: DUF4215 domain-containing protein [Myxococcales bacterium]|nr:DUF4215 domain-containing protein [Myxococcales bacterium]